MNFAVGLIIGLIVGWLIEWTIDWLFWRRRNGKLRERLTAAEAQISELTAKLAEVPTGPVRVVVKEVVKEVLKEKDHLERIRGIGPVFARRFQEAGVHTFAQLAALAPDRAREVVAVENWQAVDPDSWIAQAREFAHGSSEESDDSHGQ
jgi:predicted flap endonuclease-1-like 5' DNA nuclease